MRREGEGRKTGREGEGEREGGGGWTGRGGEGLTWSTQRQSFTAIICSCRRTVLPEAMMVIVHYRSFSFPIIIRSLNPIGSSKSHHCQNATGKGQ